MTETTAANKPETVIQETKEEVKDAELAIIKKGIDNLSSYELKLEELKLKEKSEILAYRQQWSIILLSIVVLIIIFNFLFLIAVGRQFLVFKDEWLVRLIISSSFVEVLGLAKIVVDFLFTEPTKEKDKQKSEAK